MRDWILYLLAAAAATGLVLLFGGPAARWLLRSGDGAETPQIEMARYLLENGAKVNATNTDGFTPLHGAVGACTPEVVPPNPYHDRRGRLRDFGSPTPRVPPPLPWLRQIAEQTDLAGLRKLVPPEKADSRGVGGNTPLHAVACRSGHAGMVRLLLDSGAQVDAKDIRGMTPLLYAVRTFRLDLIELILEEGADANARDPDGRTPLHLLAYPYNRPRPENAEALAVALIEHGADPNARDNAGITPLQRAARVDKHPLGLIRALVEGGADVNAGGAQGRGALDAIVDRGIVVAADYLRAHGAVLKHRPDPLADLRAQYP